MQDKVHYMHFSSQDHMEQDRDLPSSGGKETPVFIKGVHIAYAGKTHIEEMGCPVQSDTPCLQMHFELQGNAIYKAGDKEGIDCRIPAGHHALFYSPVPGGRPGYSSVRDRFSVKIALAFSYLERVFNGDLSPLGSFGYDVKRGHPAILGNKSFPISPAMEVILREMHHCRFAAALKRIYIEGKLLELLSLQVSQITLALSGEAGGRRGKGDMERIAEIRKTIEANIEKPYSIEELSRLAGINRTKLQKDFKEVHGKTIYGYIADLRMGRAVELLCTDRTMKIAEIARQVGYKNANHFSAAFKKRFGIIPRRQRQCGSL